MDTKNEGVLSEQTGSIPY